MGLRKYVLLVLVATLIQACTKDDSLFLPPTQQGEMQLQERTSEMEFDDVALPVTRDYVTIESAFVFGDSLYVVFNRGTLKKVVCNNTCVLDEELLANGFVQNDTFRVKMPTPWVECSGSQLSGQLWDFIITDINIP